MQMLTYTNIEGKKEAVSKQTVVRFSQLKDMVFNEERDLTLIHLSTREQLRSIDKMETLIKRMRK